MREPGVDLARLVHTLELRWRGVLLRRSIVDALSVSLAVSLAVLLIRAAYALTLGPGTLVLLNASALVVALLAAAIARREPAQFLIDADRVYGLKSLLLSGYEFADAASARAFDDQRSQFERIVAARAQRMSGGIDPRRVYPARTPRRIAITGALATAVATVLLLDASGLFASAAAPYAETGLLLEDAGRRLAARAERDEELLDLAREFARLSELLRGDQIDRDEARRRVDSLSDRVEQQLRNLERTAPFDHDETELLPDAEAAIRGALQAGMSESDVVELFVRMRSEGETIPDFVEALEEAHERRPDTAFGLDEERLRELMEQLSRPQPPDDATDLTEELRESQRVLEQTGAGLIELTKGDDRQIGEALDSGVGRDAAPQRTQADEVPADDAASTRGDPGDGLEGGTAAAETGMDGDFRRPEGGPIFRELRGVVTEGTIMEIIIRDVPAEATSGLSEQERAIVIERVVEEAVARENPPPQLRSLVRNYFLRLAGTGANDERE